MSNKTIQGLRKMALAAAALVMPMAASAGLEPGKVLKTANIENGKNIYFNGKGDVPACASCHGQEGLGDDAMGTPRLAGQSFTYIRKQLEDYASDKRTDTTMFVMNANAKGLSEQDRIDVAAYLFHWEQPYKGSDLKAVEELGQPVGKRYLGKSIVIYGAPERGITSCYACHQYNGRGSFPMYPELVGQKYVYLVNQLKKWRDESRANDPAAQMRKVAKHMTDEDIHNVATYLTTAPLTTIGNSFVPHPEVP